MNYFDKLQFSSKATLTKGDEEFDSREVVKKLQCCENPLDIENAYTVDHLTILERLLNFGSYMSSPDFQLPCGDVGPLLLYNEEDDQTVPDSTLQEPSDTWPELPFNESIKPCHSTENLVEINKEKEAICQKVPHCEKGDEKTKTIAAEEIAEEIIKEKCVTTKTCLQDEDSEADLSQRSASDSVDYLADISGLSDLDCSGKKSVDYLADISGLSDLECSGKKSEVAEEKLEQSKEELPAERTSPLEKEKDSVVAEKEGNKASQQQLNSSQESKSDDDNDDKIKSTPKSSSLCPTPRVSSPKKNVANASSQEVLSGTPQKSDVVVSSQEEPGSYFIFDEISSSEDSQDSISVRRDLNSCDQTVPVISNRFLEE